MINWPDDTLVEQLPAPAFTIAGIFSLSFLIIRNIDSGGLSALRMVDVNSPLSYLLKISICYPRVIDFLTFFLPGAFFSLGSCFGATIHMIIAQKKHKITAKTLRRTIENANYVREHKRTCLHGRSNSRRRDAERDLSAVLVTPPPPHHSVPPTSRRT